MANKDNNHNNLNYKKCLLDRCDSTVKGRGLCGKHYQRVLKGKSIYGKNPWDGMDHKYTSVECWSAVCIPLTKGRHALIDAEDFDKVNTRKWSLSGAQGMLGLFYADAGFSKKTVRLHNFILDRIPEKGMACDHINHDGLDNRKSNLRIITQEDNVRNSRKCLNKSSGHKGVYWDKKDRRWIATYSSRGNQRVIGRFLSEIDAALAYNEFSVRQSPYALQNVVTL